MANMTESPALPSVTGSAWQGVRYFCTVRAGGVSTGPYASMNLGRRTQDDSAHVLENRRRLRAEVPAEPFWLNQVHGVQVADADQEGEALSADASVTSAPGRVLAIMTADCLPVVIADVQGRAVGIAHAGWRGLAEGVLEQTLSRLQAKVGGDAQWQAWVGPGISQPHFEVGADVYEAFVGRDSRTGVFFAPRAADKKWLADLPGLARHRLQAAGVAQVELSGCCTYGEPERFFSYRRRPDSGRMVTVAWLTGE